MTDTTPTAPLSSDEILCSHLSQLAVTAAECGKKNDSFGLAVVTAQIVTEVFANFGQHPPATVFQVFPIAHGEAEYQCAEAVRRGLTPTTEEAGTLLRIALLVLGRPQTMRELDLLPGDPFATVLTRINRHLDGRGILDLFGNSTGRLIDGLIR